MPDTSPLPEYLAETPRSSRPREETTLSLFLRTHGITFARAAQEMDCSDKSIQHWANGQALPSLVYAFKIERWSRGAVPIASWLGTEIGRLTWLGRGRE